jgi:hypothetical protein
VQRLFAGYAEDPGQQAVVEVLFGMAHPEEAPFALELAQREVPFGQPDYYPVFAKIPDSKGLALDQNSSLLLLLLLLLLRRW